MKSKMRTLLLFLPLLIGGSLIAQSSVQFKRTEDVIYGRKDGVALTLDVIQPVGKSNGYAILTLMSGGWISGHDQVNPAAYREFLERGYTVFAVVHGSQPKFQIPEIIDDIHRAVRYVRHNASTWGIDPNHIGITGGSAGGHLSLTMGTQGGPGPANAPDAVDRESSAVQAVACFYPPSDFLNYGSDGEDGVGRGKMQTFHPAFGVRADSSEGRKELGRQISPYYFISSKMPPTLIIHGDADQTVPLQQSERFVKRAMEAGAIAKLIVVPGAGHGSKYMGGQGVFIVDWFDLYLRGLKK